MALEDDIAWLSGVPLFGHFAQEHLRLIAFGSENMRFNAGRSLYREDDPADCAYVITSGSVVLSQLRHGEQVEVGHAGPGDTLGDTALIAATRRAATAQARSDTEAIRISRSLVRRILDEYPQLASGMHKVLAEDLGRTLSDLGRLASRFAD